jgi:hypothetical protein
MRRTSVCFVLLVVAALVMLSALGHGANATPTPPKFVPKFRAAMRMSTTANGAPSGSYIGEILNDNVRSLLCVSVRCLLRAE